MTQRKPKSVWVIEQGCYSDYRVVGVFSNKKNADLVAKHIARAQYSDTPKVAEWPLDPAVGELSKGYTRWNVTMLRDGTVELCEPDYRDGDLGEGVYLWERTRAPAYVGKGVQDALRVSCLARNGKHAVKIANEKRVEMIAANKWPPA